MPEAIGRTPCGLMRKAEEPPPAGHGQQGEQQQGEGRSACQEVVEIQRLQGKGNVEILACVAGIRTTVAFIMNQAVLGGARIGCIGCMDAKTQPLREHECDDEREYEWRFHGCGQHCEAKSIRFDAAIQASDRKFIAWIPGNFSRLWTPNAPLREAPSDGGREWESNPPKHAGVLNRI